MSDRQIAVIAPEYDEEQWAGRLAAHGAARAGVWPDVAADEVRYAAVWLPPTGTFTAMPNLEVIFNLGAGVDHLLADPDLPQVPVVRSVDEDLTQRMSEHVVLHALLHLRDLTSAQRRQRNRVWHWQPTPTAGEVTVGIMGLGVLGGDAAARLRAVGFEVAGWARTPKTIDGVATYAGRDGLGAFLARTDILVCLLPATTETRGILDAGLFARLRRDGPLRGPVLINAGRGRCHVEADVIAALRDGTLAAASLDVFETEPLPESSPLWAMDNVVITPHSAADSDPDALAANVMRQIRAYEAGGAAALHHVVDRERGY